MTRPDEYAPAANPPSPAVPGAGRRAAGQHATHAHPTARRVLRVLLVTTIAVTVLAAGGGVFAYYKLQGNITATNIDGLLGNDRPEDETAVDPTTGQDALNILIMGSDTRALADGTGNAYGGEGADPGARSDTTVLVHLAADRRSATLVNIPRDSMVQRPECTRSDGTNVPAELDMFNAAFSEGGPACTIRTVEALTHIRIDHHAVIDFSGFRSMVDALGGVTICTPVDINDTKANLHLAAGTHDDVDGETALAYARVRYSLGDGSDIQRIPRQQALMSSMVQKLTSTGTLTRPDRLYAFLDAATKSVTTDPGLASLADDVKLAQSVQKMPTSGVQFVTVPTEPYPRNTARVQWTATAASLWDSIRTDTAGPSATATASPSATVDPSDSSQLLVAPGDVRVQVLNVGAPSGTAGTVADQLTAVGFTTTGTGDGPATMPGASVVVRYGSEQADAGATVAAALGGATTQLDPSLGRTVVVEVATSGVSVVDVRARVTGTTMTSTPTAPITGRVASDDICA